jgi:hypothetical protein
MRSKYEVFNCAWLYGVARKLIYPQQLFRTVLERVEAVSKTSCALLKLRVNSSLVLSKRGI